MKHRHLLIALLGTSSAIAAPPGARIEDMSLDDLMDMETGIATTTPMAPRELPGIVTVLHRDELLRSGARDVLDVLQRLPGLQVSHDVLGVLGVGIRGRWSAEGRLLLLIDGQAVTEPMYGTTPLGGRIPLHLVQRIEILRGAASARYGGGASGAVIHIITVAGDGTPGVGLQAEACVRPTGMGCVGLSGSAVVQGKKARYAAHAFAAHQTVSAGEYEDFWGGTLDVGGANTITPTGLTLNVQHGETQLSVGMDAQMRRQGSGYDEVQEEPAPNHFQMAWARASTRRQLGAAWTLTPKAELSMHRPWHSGTDVDPNGYLWYERALTRAESELGLLGELGEHTQLDLGAGGHADWIQSSKQWEVFPLPTNKRYGVYGTGFLRAEVLWVGKGFNLAAGARAEYASPVGFRWAPRVALTSAGKVFHSKLLVSGATRAPTYEQAFANPELQAEQGIEVEAELGARLTSDVHLRANVFASETFNPIVYRVVDEWDSYWNATPNTTAGGELEASYRKSNLAFDLNYAYYRRIGKDDDYWVAPGHDDRRASFAPHTATAQVRWSPVDGVWFSPSVRLLGPRTVWAGVTADEEIYAADLPTAALVDVAVRFEEVAKHVDITVSGHDLLGQDPGWHQPFEGWHAPLPGRGRELVIKLGWRK